MIALSLLSKAAGGVLEGSGDIGITRLCLDSRLAAPGDLFVALGDGPAVAQHVREAVVSGAIAACVSRATAAALHGTDVALLVVAEPRAALGRMSAAFYGDPARDLRLIGVTGTLGKTSTAVLIQAAHPSASGGRGVGVVGSLGATVPGADEANHLAQLGGMTTPDAPDLHAALRAMGDAGVRIVAMEVTSHALAQDRIEGLSYSIGVITNLVPDEHLDFHGTAANYLRTKARFLEYLKPAAPLIVNADDPLVLAMAAGRCAAAGPLVGVTLEAPGVTQCDERTRCDALVVARKVTWDGSGSRFTLRLADDFPLVDGGTGAAMEVRIELPLLGVQHVTNAALAATTALVAGASAAEVTAGLARVEPVRRRMQILRPADPCVIDDTTGNPEALEAVFRTIGAIPHSALRIVFGLRGSRGTEINARLASRLAELVAERADPEQVRLVVTCSEDAAGPRDRVKSEERDAALDALGSVFRTSHLQSRVSWFVEPTLSGAVARTLEDVQRTDLVLVLGTQPMDTAGELVLRYLNRRPTTG